MPPPAPKIGTTSVRRGGSDGEGPFVLPVALLATVLCSRVLAGKGMAGDGGEGANAVYFLVHGAIAIHASGRRGARELGHFRVGAYFGEEGCLLGAHWRAQLSADGACEAQLIEAANLEMLLNHYVTVRDEVYATAALRVRQSALLGVDAAEKAHARAPAKTAPDSPPQCPFLAREGGAAPAADGRHDEPRAEGHGGVDGGAARRGLLTGGSWGGGARACIWVRRGRVP